MKVSKVCAKDEVVKMNDGGTMGSVVSWVYVERLDSSYSL